jgi:hypothetical protein
MIGEEENRCGGGLGTSVPSGGGTSLGREFQYYGSCFPRVPRGIVGRTIVNHDDLEIPEGRAR